MTFVNATRETRVYISTSTTNTVDVTNLLIGGNLSDDSAYTNSIITTSGQVILGTSNSALDIDQTTYPIGSVVKIWCKLDSGEYALHPRGTMFVIDSAINVEEKQLILEVGCSLAFISDKEEEYESAVSQLYDDLVSAAALNRYVIDKRDLSTLSSLLQVEGLAIYQDPYGNIQTLNAFGNDGIGTTLVDTKLTSFDKHSAIDIQSISEDSIEGNVASVQIDASTDVPSIDYGDSGTNKPTPDPLITAVLRRKVDAPFGSSQIVSTTQGLIRLEFESTAGVTSETTARCGTIDNPGGTPGGTTVSNFAWRASGGLNVTTRSVNETVTTGRYVSYDGVGRQVDREETWEYASAVTWAKPSIQNTITGIANGVSGLVSEMNGLLSKANQYGEAFVNVQNSDPDRAAKHDIYNCHYNSYLDQARRLRTQATNLIEAGNQVSFGPESAYGLASFSQTLNEYDRKSGALEKRITRNYVNNASLEGQGTHNVLIDLTGNLGQSQVIDNGLISTNTTALPTGKIDNPTSRGLFLANETVTTYDYNKLYTIETEEYEDHIDTNRNYKKVSYSASGSANPEQPDRLITQDTIGGQQFCSGNTTQKELSAKVPIQSEVIVGQGWFGNSKPYDKKVSFPLTFAPILPVFNAANNTCTAPDQAAKLNEYKAVLKKYALVIAKKISGDNRGFRVSERLRAEIFEYYPFFPITISLESIQRAFITRSAAATWVFDAQNALCSFDCLLTGDIASPTGGDPTSNPVFIKTDAAKTLTVSDLDIQSTATQIKLLSLPTSGTLALNGVTCTVNQVINKTDIASNLLVYTPSSAGTKEIAFSYQAIDTNGTVLSSELLIYPPLTTEVATDLNYFADCGDFDANSSTGGTSAGAGDFDTGTTAGGFVPFNAGDFDTGTAVTYPAPVLLGAPTTNGSRDPETQFGVNVKDQNDVLIATNTLPVSRGGTTAAFDIFVDAAIDVDVVASLTTRVIDQVGWSYGFFTLADGTNFDFGSFASPNNTAINFGTFAAPIEPALASGVV